MSTPYRVVSTNTVAWISPTHGVREVSSTGMQLWTRYTTSGDFGQKRPTTWVEFGPGAVEGLDRRLLGDVSDNRILELGCGSGGSSIALAKRGARVVAIDSDKNEAEMTRAAAEAAEVHVEVHNVALADLAFLQADSFDAVISIHSLATVGDVGRVFRQVHRLLKTDQPLVFSLPHPVALIADPEDGRSITSSYDESEPLGAGHHLTYRHGISHLFTQLTRANYRVDTLLEPSNVDASTGSHRLPASVVFRARKIGA